MRMSTFALLTLNVLVLLVRTRSYEATEKELSSLPDFGKPHVRRKLRCSACRASIIELYEGFVELQERKGGENMKEYDRLEVVEAVVLTINYHPCSHQDFR